MALNPENLAAKYLLKTSGKGTLSDSDLRKVEQMTDQNAHSEALKYISQKILRNGKLTKAFEAIVVLHDHFGNINLIGQARNKLYEQLKASMKQKLSPEDYTKLHGAL